MSEEQHEETGHNGHDIVKERAGTIRHAMMVMQKGPTEAGPWTPIHEKDVPDWIKRDPVMIGRMRKGYAVRNDDVDPDTFYRCIQLGPEVQ